jgi:hypothetical protein
MDTTGIRYRCAWLVHVLGVRRNPLRRGLDLVTAATMALLLVIGLAAIPASVMVGSSFHDQQVRAAAADAAQRYPVVASLTGPPQVHVTGDADYNRAAVADAPVRWSDRAGQEHSAMVTVPAQNMQHDTTTVWIDESGRLSPPPRSQAEVLASAVTVAIGLLLAVEVCVLVLAAGVRRLSDLYARRAWAHEWEVVARRWTGPRQ